MVQGINSNLNNYMVQNTGLTQTGVQETLAKSSQAVSDTVESNALVNSAMGIDKNSMLLAVPLVGLIKYINNGLMSGNESKSLVGKIANFGDKVSDKLNLAKLDGSGQKVANYLKKNKYTKYFTDDFKAIPKSSFAKTVRMSEKYASALLDTLGTAGVDVSVVKLQMESGCAITSLTDDIIKLADDYLLTNPAKGKNQISGLRNMLKAADSKVGKSALGKTLSKGLLKTKEIAFSTSDFLSKDPISLLGDFFSIALFAGVLIRASKEAKEAPKGEKVATFMHVLSTDYVPLMVMQPTTSLAYKLGGNKYRGMTKQGRDALTNLIKTTNANKSLTKEGYKIAKMQQKLLLKGVDEKKVAELATKGLDDATTLFKSLKSQGAKLNPIEWVLKKAGTILDVGLDTINSPKLMGKIGNKMKGFFGGFGRLVLILFVLQPFLQKPITKLVHKIFGEPKAYLAKEKAAEKAAEAQSTQQASPLPNSDTNLINRYTRQQSVQQPQSVQQQNPFVQPQQQNVQPVASQPIASTPVNNSGRYIPSIAVNYAAEDTSALDAQADAILRSTDALMARARKCL